MRVTKHNGYTSLEKQNVVVEVLFRKIRLAFRREVKLHFPDETAFGSVKQPLSILTAKFGR